MNQTKKDEILNGLKIIESTKKFINKMEPGFGNLIKNTKKKEEKEPDYIGWARLDDGTVISITGNLKKIEGKDPILPIRVVEVPGEMIGESDTKIAQVPNYKESKDGFM